MIYAHVSTDWRSKEKANMRTPRWGQDETMISASSSRPNLGVFHRPSFYQSEKGGQDEAEGTDREPIAFALVPLGLI